MSVQTTWNAGYLDAHYLGNAQEKTHELVSQDEIWVTARGDVLYIEEMDSNHLLNTILFLERVAWDVYATIEDNHWLNTTPDNAQQWLVSTPVYEGLKDEVLRRMISEYVTQADEADKADETLSPPHDHVGMPDPKAPFFSPTIQITSVWDFSAEQTGNDGTPEPEFGEVRLG